MKECPKDVDCSPLILSLINILPLAETGKIVDYCTKLIQMKNIHTTKGYFKRAEAKKNSQNLIGALEDYEMAAKLRKLKSILQWDRAEIFNSLFEMNGPALGQPRLREVAAHEFTQSYQQVPSKADHFLQYLYLRLRQPCLYNFWYATSQKRELYNCYSQELEARRAAQNRDFKKSLRCLEEVACQLGDPAEGRQLVADVFSEIDGH